MLRLSILKGNLIPDQTVLIYGRGLDAVAELLQSSETLKKYNFFELVPRLQVDNQADAKTAMDALKRMGSDVVKFRNRGGDNFLSLAISAMKVNIINMVVVSN